MINYIKLLLIIIYFLLKINSESVKNENDFLKIISYKNKNTTINVENIIDFSSDINIDESLNKISIIGNSQESSILNFINLSEQLNFNENVQEIELLNITIIGNISFNNNKRIIIKGVSVIGYIYSNFENENEYIKISDFLYNTSNYNINDCISLGGNIEIENSKFNGSSSCQNKLFNYDGFDKYKLTIKNSHFIGEYKCSCINISNSIYATIDYSLIENCYSNNGGG